MRIAQATLIAALVALTTAAPAAAWKGTFEGTVAAGPALSGSGIAWADGQHQSGPMTIKRAPLDGPATILYSVAREGTCDRIDDLAATADLVAVHVYRGAADGSCLNAGMDILVNDGSGSPKTLESTDGDSVACQASGLDADAGVVAVARYNCQSAPVMLHDVAAGTSAPLGLPLRPGAQALEVRLAGRYLAVLTEEISGPGTHLFEVVVWDREAGSVAYRADATAFRGADDYVIGSHRLELQADGRVLYGVTAVSPAPPTVRYGVASPADPVLRAIPGEFEQSMGRVGFAGGLAVLKRAFGKGSAVFGTDGGLLNLFSARATGGSLDFDGTRLVWSDWDYLYNVPYPYEEPVAAPTPTPTPAPAAPVAPPKPAAVPAATVAALKARQKVRALKTFTGTASDADGDLAMVRVGLVRLVGKKCQTLQKSGRLKASKPVGGKCIPATFLTATGTSAWKFKLRKRLPAGRYVLYVQAVDAAGHAPAAFSKAAGNLRSFTLR